MLRLPDFIMLFQLVLTTFSKSELFSCFPKDDHVINYQKGMYENERPNSILLLLLSLLLLFTKIGIKMNQFFSRCP